MRGKHDSYKPTDKSYMVNYDRIFNKKKKKYRINVYWIVTIYLILVSYIIWRIS